MMSKKVEQWDKIRQSLKKEFTEKGITQCEVHLTGCFGAGMLTFAHRKKRRFYKNAEELGQFNEVVLACVNCHVKLEQDAELTKEVFENLRGQSNMADKKEKDKGTSKRAIWMKSHACIHCKKQNSGMLICPFCKKISV